MQNSSSYFAFLFTIYIYIFFKINNLLLYYYNHIKYKCNNGIKYNNKKSNNNSKNKNWNNLRIREIENQIVLSFAYYSYIFLVLHLYKNSEKWLKIIHERKNRVIQMYTPAYIYVKYFAELTQIHMHDK